MYTYRIAKEDITGKRCKRTRIIERRTKMKVGGLYVHLGRGIKGTYRVLEEIKEVEE